MKYGIAYLDENFEGYSNTEPWIADVYNKNQISEMIEEMKEFKYKMIIPFQYSYIKENYDWNYIFENMVKIEV